VDGSRGKEGGKGRRKVENEKEGNRRGGVVHWRKTKRSGQSQQWDHKDDGC